MLVKGGPDVYLDWIIATFKKNKDLNDMLVSSQIKNKWGFFKKTKISSVMVFGVVLQYAYHYTICLMIMVTSSNGNIFSVAGPFCGEFTGNRWIPLTKASDEEFWCFLWSAPE